MRADYIKEIIGKYGDLPYKCILFDGPWGVGKSYAINQALTDNKNACNISMFGIEDAQEIYHEAFFQLMLKDKKKISEMVSRIIDAGTDIFGKMKVAKRVITSLVKEKEIFLNLSKEFKDLRLIIIDDLERMSNSIRLEEVFGIIEELKKCSNVKIILVANMAELSQKEIFDRYSEKVIDRIYCIDEPSKNVDWTRLNIHYGFIAKFLSNHDVKNLRTLQKAQNLYDDVKLKLRDGYKEEFYDEIRLACFAIVVESIDNLYYKKSSENQTDVAMRLIQTASNEIGFRINNHYLEDTRISKNMVELLKEYYENKIDLLEDEIEAEYQIFVHAGEKANFYKSDKELELVLPYLAESIKHEASIAKLMRYADEYIIWSGHLQINIEEMMNEYKERLHDIIYAEVMKGKIEYLTYGIESFYIQSLINKEIVRELNDSIKKEAVKTYVEYLSKNAEGEQAYRYSYFLRDFANNGYLKDAICGAVDALYTEKLFPIYDVTEEKYRISQNVMYVLYFENKDKLLAYCDELKNKCDHMASHRISVILKGLTENGQ